MAGLFDEFSPTATSAPEETSTTGLLDEFSPAATPIPGVDDGKTATAELVQPVLDPLAKNPVVKGVNATARALAMPVTHPKEFVQGLANEVNDTIIGAAEVTGEPNEFLRRNLNPNYQVPEHLGEAPIVRMVPFAKTSGDIVTEEGRAELAEHPEQVALDVLGVIPSGSVGKLAGKVPGAVSKVGGVAAKTAPGRALVEKLAAGTAKVREVMPSVRAQEVSALPTAQRAAAQEVSRNYGATLEALQKADLAPEQTTALRESLDRGMRPDDEVLGPLYDEVKTHSEADRTRKLERDIPEELKSVVVDQVEATLGPKMAATGLGPERTRAMFEALRKGADNPFPEASKAWNQMRLETSRRILSRQRDARLFEFDAGIPGIESQVYPWRDFSRLRAAKNMMNKGKLTPEAYRAVVDKITPGKYEPMLQAQKTELALAANRARFEPGYGKASYDAMSRESMTTWTELAEQGVNPVYVPREALRQLTDEARPAGPKVTVAKPSSLKKAGGVSEFFETDPAVMFLKNEYDLANQTTVQKAIADVYRSTGGKPFARALDDYMAQGYSRAQAENLIRSNFVGFKLDGTTTKPAPGMLLVRRDVGAALKTYVEKTMPSLADELFGMWMVPTLWLSPRFHINNVAGGALMVGLKSPNSLLDYLAYGREAVRSVRAGDMNPRIPFGAGMAPQFTKRFTQESRIAEGGRLAGIWRKLHDKERSVLGNSLPGRVAQHVVHPIDSSRRFNEFMDSVNKTIVYLSEHDKALRQGVDSFTARDLAGKAAANLMQNWDSFSPIERMIVQRVYPFWGFRKAMLRTILTYPMDHPLRMHFLEQVARDVEEREGLPEEWEHLVGISGVGKDGKQYYLSTKGLDPFADISDFFTFKGFLQNVNPLSRPFMEAPGIDTYRGGVPQFAFADQPPDIDLATGKLKRPIDKTVLWDLIPQLGAVARWTGLKSVPPPDENTPDGWMRWLDTYGASLGVTPGIRRLSEEEERQKFREALETWAEFQARAEAKRAEAAAQ